MDTMRTLSVTCDLVWVAVIEHSHLEIRVLAWHFDCPGSYGYRQHQAT